MLALAGLLGLFMTGLVVDVPGLLNGKGDDADDDAPGADAEGAAGSLLDDADETAPEYTLAQLLGDDDAEDTAPSDPPAAPSLFSTEGLGIGAADPLAGAVDALDGLTDQVGGTAADALDGALQTALTKVTQGTDAADNIIAGDQADQIAGYGGDDLIDGGDGTDVISGGDGNDSLAGGADEDLLHGEYGDDVVDGGTGADKLFGHTGADILDGGDGDDALNGGFGDDILRGGDGNDSMEGGYGFDTLIGGTGIDTMMGGAGNDLLDGRVLGTNGIDTDQMDFLNGGDGSDDIIAGAGDYAYGGAGADTFMVGDWIEGGANAIIQDFDSGADSLVVQVDATDLPSSIITIDIDAVGGNSHVLLNGHVIATVDGVTDLVPAMIQLVGR